MVRIGVALAFVGVVALARPARGQFEATHTEARRHFEQGLRLYNVQSYDDAIVEFKAGYQIEPRPEFLYALGQAQRMNRQCKAAIVSYEAFLRTSPGARQESAARDQIQTCRAELAAETSAPASPQVVPAPTAPNASAGAVVVAPPPASAEPTTPSTDAIRVAPELSAPSAAAPPLYRRWWFWAMVGGGVAAGLAIAAAAGAFTRTRDAGCPANVMGCYPAQ